MSENHMHLLISKTLTMSDRVSSTTEELPKQNSAPICTQCLGNQCNESFQKQHKEEDIDETRKGQEKCTCPQVMKKSRGLNLKCLALLLVPVMVVVIALLVVSQMVILGRVDELERQIKMCKSARQRPVRDWRYRTKPAPNENPSESFGKDRMSSAHFVNQQKSRLTFQNLGRENGDGFEGTPVYQMTSYSGNEIKNSRSDEDSESRQLSRRARSLRAVKEPSISDKIKGYIKQELKKVSQTKDELFVQNWKEVRDKYDRYDRQGNKKVTHMPCQPIVSHKSLVYYGNKSKNCSIGFFKKLTQTNLLRFIETSGSFAVMVPGLYLINVNVTVVYTRHKKRLGLYSNEHILTSCEHPHFQKHNPPHKDHHICHLFGIVPLRKWDTFSVRTQDHNTEILLTESGRSSASVLAVLLKEDAQ